jgi:hypothetical protein
MIEGLTVWVLFGRPSGFRVASSIDDNSWKSLCEMQKVLKGTAALAGRSNFDIENAIFIITSILSDIWWWSSEGDKSGWVCCSRGNVVCMPNCHQLWQTLGALCYVGQVCSFSWLTEFGSCSGQLYICGVFFDGTEGNLRRFLHNSLWFEK